MATSSKLSLSNKRSISILLISIPLILSAFVHLWNPVGFPSIHTDEGHYMRRAMHVMQGYGPQEEISKYDHPYFGQIFLGSILKVIGYPDTVNPTIGNIQSIEMLYLVPRVIMGILAVVDTLLIFKIVELRYNRIAALIASVFFAVLPYTFTTRQVFLDNLQLPFLLSSILLVCYIKIAKDTSKWPLLVLASGVTMGISLFTKIPVITFIPLFVYLIYSNTGRKLRYVILWFFPVIAITALWPLHAISIGQFDDWQTDVIWQTNRADRPLVDQLVYLVSTDPIVVILGFSGIIVTAIRKDLLPLLWTIPFLAFLYIIGYVSSFFFVPIFPGLCIAAALLIYEISRLKIIQDTFTGKMGFVTKVIPISILLPILAYALMVNATAIKDFENHTYLKVQETITSVLADHDTQYVGNRSFVSVLSNPGYSWVPKYAFNLHDNKYENYYGTRSVIDTYNNPGGYLLVVDNYYRDHMLDETRKGTFLETLYNNSLTVARIKGNEIIPVMDNDTSQFIDIKTSWMPSLPSLANTTTS